jgi:hypothetical protein
MIIRRVFSLAVLGLAGVLVVALSGHLWGRYQEQAATIGFSGSHVPPAAQAGSTGDPQTSGAVAEGEGEASPAVREAAAVEE